ncbi:MAG: helix-turn-helix domain-containing protein, partial [Dolichospermum sp.]
MIKKKRITIAAVPELIKQAETALIKLGFESKSNFAESQLISRNTVTNFFQGKSIQIDSLKRICEALKLNWQDFVTTEQPVEIPSIDSETKIIIIKVVITLDGDINSVDKIEFLQDMQAILRQYSGTITDVKSGSIKLFIEGNQADIERLVDLIQGKILTELNGFPIQSIEM